MNDVQLLDTAAASTFAADWRAYFNNAHLSDIELRVEGRAIPAHRVVLAARCDYFARLLLSGMREAQGGVIEVDGVRYEIFLALLEYLYTDALDFAPECALELLTAADRYGLDRLKRECVNSVEACLRTCTVCHVLTVADQHLAEDLREVRARRRGGGARAGLERARVRARVQPTAQANHCRARMAALRACPSA
jgi:hypothetical protein